MMDKSQFLGHNSAKNKVGGKWGEMKQGQVETVTMTFMGDNV